MRPYEPILILVVVAHLLARQACAEVQTLDGSMNNPSNPLWGAVNTTMLRLMAPAFEGLAGQPAGSDRANARNISNQLFVSNHASLLSAWSTPWLSAWGMFVAQDIGGIYPSSSFFNITVPTGDAYFDRYASGTQVIPMRRAVLGAADPRQQGAATPLNSRSSFLDGSSLYGQTTAELSAIRAGTGGLLITDNHPVAGIIPPINATSGLLQFSRAALNVAPHSVLVHLALWREHNRFARTLNQSWSDEELFQYTRRYIIALIQQITYSQYLPPLLGYGLPAYSGYNSSVNPNVDVYFIAAAFRYGHSLINDALLNVNADNQIVGLLEISSTFFSIQWLLDSGPEGYIRGMITQSEKLANAKYANALRNSLPLSGNQGYDLAAIDIQRGREFGLPDYNTARQYFDLAPASSFESMGNNNSATAALLASLFPSVNSVDAVVGGLLEATYDGGAIGALSKASILDQFTRLRSGDRFFYLNPGVLDAFQASQVQGMSLGTLLQLNFNLTNVPYNPCVLSPSSIDAVMDLDSTKKSTIYLTPQFALQWIVMNNESITFTMNYSGGGWFAFGLGSTMSGADIYYATYLNGSLTVVDAVAKDFGMPVPDTQVGGYNNIYNVTTAIGGSMASVTFTRPLLTNDTLNDVNITSRNMPVIFAYSSATAPSYHGPNRGYALINFLNTSLDIDVCDSEDDDDSTSKSLLIIHGAVMAVAFGFMYPIGIIIVKYDPNISRGIRVHRETMELVSSFTLHTAIIAIAGSFSGGDMNTHVILGFTIAGLIVVVQVLGAFVVHTKKYAAMIKYSAWIRLIHRYSGAITYTMGAVNCVFGIQLLWEDLGIPHLGFVAWIFVGWMILVTLVIIGGSRLFRFHNRGGCPPSFDPNKWSALPVLTWNEFHQKIGKGEKWLVVEDIIYDIKAIETTHPGGQQVLYFYLGMDATDPYSGKKTHPDIPALPAHNHSKLAKVVLYEAAVGRIVAKKEPASSRSLSTTKTDLEKDFGKPGLGLSIWQYNHFSITGNELVTGEGAKNPVYRITVALESSNEEARFLPYQYVWLQFVTDQGQVVTRAYTPVKVVNTGRISFYIKFYSDGKMSNYLSTAKYVRMRGPIDDLKLVRLMCPGAAHGCFEQLALIAGGSGLTPMLLLADYYFHTAPRRPDGKFVVPIKLFHINSSQADAFADEELNHLERVSNGMIQCFRLYRSSSSATHAEHVSHVMAEVLRHLPPPPKESEQKVIRKLEKTKRVIIPREKKSPSRTAMDLAQSVKKLWIQAEPKDMSRSPSTEPPTETGLEPRQAHIVGTRIVVCGPPSMNESIATELEEAGYIDEMVIVL
ncbi:heme peroxidase [Polychytrium aggregatum]|uniref:heme peroxidase n=1 Tax=Polychytrium aggregatum TaxID=110093 RepID=UPI0022FEAF5C|nr:heme peroxidase [Polychytrium aggregatum]KAI9199647.1 heme peroxidase [Polychytrium aggregatum]